MPAGFPPLTLPNLSLVEELWPGAVGIALMSFIETAAVGRAFRGKGEPQPDPDRELVALGAANVAGGFFGCMPSGGGTSQSAVSRSAGAKTQLCGAVGALGALATLLFLAPLLGLMPSAALAAVVVATSIPLIKVGDFRAIAKIRKTELIWALAATAGVVALGTLKGILVAVVVSLVALAAQAVRPPVYEVRRKPGTPYFRHVSPEHPEDEAFPGVLLVRIVGRLFFLNVKNASDALAALAEAAQPRVLVIDCRPLIDLEYTALKVLIEAEESMRGRGILLCLASLNHHVRDIVERSPLGATLGRERMFFNLEQAVAAAPCAPGEGGLARREGEGLMRRDWRTDARRLRWRLQGLLVLLALLLAPAVAAEEPAAARPSLFRDPEDGAIDLSGWLATRTGVLPLVSPITEPAVGFGAAVALVHFSGGGLAGALKAPPGASGRPVPPDVAVLGGGLTENGTWAVLGAYIGHWKGDRWRYKAAAGWLSPTLDYYGANGRSFAVQHGRLDDLPGARSPRREHRSLRGAPVPLVRPDGELRAAARRPPGSRRPSSTRPKRASVPSSSGTPGTTR